MLCRARAGPVPCPCRASADLLRLQGDLLLFGKHDRAAAQAAYGSPGYEEALAALGKGNVEREIRIIEGV